MGHVLLASRVYLAFPAPLSHIPHRRFDLLRASDAPRSAPHKAELEAQLRQQQLDSLRHANEQQEVLLQGRIEELHKREYRYFARPAIHPPAPM